MNFNRTFSDTITVFGYHYFCLTGSCERLHRRPIHQFYNIQDDKDETISASCSIAPDSRRSDNNGRLLDPQSPQHETAEKVQ
jgi:hypothetical protein